ncbi:S1C family serine protease [Bariatricus sp. HCP28S3_A7]|uniref:S1C family serine protease n=1 Tax=Lachnospiraceae TaxID=186803 RepID=UPI002A7D0AD0|nr:trypsin-like peptidase domain-containing protein [Bariatricus sp.]MDY4195322.1 trypsin-like peptidase domain-containing protein [Bariatricus sp.]
MENQYNYYRPDDDNNTDRSFQESRKAPKPKKKFPKKAIAVAGFAVMFGVIGGLTFQGTNYITGKLLGTTSTKEETKSTKTVANTQLTTSKTAVSSDVSDIVDATLPSIVSITNMSVQQVQDFFGGIRQQESKSAGSGIIISQNDTELLIVTNNHVVEGSETLTVTFVDETSVEALIKGTDSARDLAVVAVPLEKIPDETMDAIKLATLCDSDGIKVGEPAIAIGNALGYGQSVTMGIVSATERTISGYDGTYIQTDAAINPGNSGGALLNINGEVIGINSAKINASEVEGMGFAIPISDTTDIIENLMNKETRSKVSEAERGYLGIKGYDVTEEGAQMYNMPTGVFIAEVIDGGGAKDAGLTKGMIITEFDGSSVDDMETLKGLLEYYKVGEEVSVKVQVPEKNGEYTEQEVTVKLGKAS